MVRDRGSPGRKPDFLMVEPMLRFNNLPVAIKVFLAPGLLIAALVATGILALTAFNAQIATTQRLDRAVFEPLRQALEVRDRATLIHARLFALMSAAANETDSKKLDAESASLSRDFETYAQDLTGYLAALAGDPAVRNWPARS